MIQVHSETASSAFVNLPGPVAASKCHAMCACSVLFSAKQVKIRNVNSMKAVFSLKHGRKLRMKQRLLVSEGNGLWCYRSLSKSSSQDVVRPWPYWPYRYLRLCCTCDGNVLALFDC